MNRSERVRIVREMTARGASSRVIGKRLGIAESTVRDYRTDPYRQRARARQRVGYRRSLEKAAGRGRLAVTPGAVHMPARERGGTPILSLKARSNRHWHPHRGSSAGDDWMRAKQMRTVIGYYERRGRG